MNNEIALEQYEAELESLQEQLIIIKESIKLT